MNRRVVLFSLGIGALIGTAVLLVAWKHRSRNDAQAQTNSPAVTIQSQPTQPPPAASRPAGSDTVPLVTLPATLLPYENVELYAKASGYVSEINVDIGTRVHKGDVLVHVDVPELLDELKQAVAQVTARQAKIEAAKAKLTQARLAIDSTLAQQKRVEAELNLSRITHQRKAELYQGKAIPQQEYDVAQSQLDVSEADLAIAKAKVASARGEELASQADVKSADADSAVAQAETARLKTLIGYTTVKAPFDGTITLREVDHGTFVRSAALGTGSPLLVVERTDLLRLVIQVPETQAPLVRPGTEVRVQFRAETEAPFTAKVARTAFSLRAESRTMRAEVDVDNRDGRLIPGMYAQVSLQPPPREIASGARP